MTCQELIDFLRDYDDENLPREVRARFEEHLTLCPDCVHYLASYRTTIALGKSAFSDLEGATPDAVPLELLQAILNLRVSIDGQAS